MLAEAQAGKRIRRSVSLDAPVNQTPEYDTVIKMLELSTDKTVVTSDEVVSNAIASLSEAPVNNAGQPMTAQQLAKDILVTVPSDTNVLTISYSSTDPVEAATIANALAAAYEQFKQTQADDTVTKLTEELQTQSDNIQRQIDDVTAALQRAHSEGTRTSITNNLIDLTSQQASLQAQKSQIEADNVISVTTIDPATAPHDPVSPNIPLNLLASLALGLTLGFGLAFGAEGLDDHIRDRPELQRILEAPVIGSIPAVKDWRQREQGQHLAFKDDPSSPLSEAYKALATNIMYLASQDQLQIAPAWTLTLGGRQEWWRAWGGVNLASGQTLSQPERRFSGFSPKAALEWRPAPGWSARLSLGQAWRMPTVGELYQATVIGTQLSNPNPRLRPERARSGELAIERRAGKGMVRLSLFDEVVDDALISQTNLLTPGITSAYVQNVDRTRARGAELAVEQTDLPGHFDLSASLTWAEAIESGETAVCRGVPDLLAFLTRTNRGGSLAGEAGVGR